MRVQQCCCGCTLKTGTILIGVYYLVIYLAGVFLTAVILGSADDPDFKRNFFAQDSSNTLQKLSESDVLTALKVTVGILLAVFILASLLQIMLLVGAVKEVPLLVYIWFVVHVILLVILVVAIFVNAFRGSSSNGSRTGSLLPTVLNILLTIYFLLVVYSFHAEIKEKRQRPPNTNPPGVFNIEGYPLPQYANAPQS